MEVELKGGTAAENGASDGSELTASCVDTLALRLWAIQRRDPRIGYEATNHYFYVPMDLAEKVLECAWLLDGWLGENAPQSGDGGTR